MTRRWARAGADVVAAALGTNVWVSLILVPALFVGAFARHRLFVAVAPLPLLVLAAGVVRRSPFLLLLAYPAALLAPIGVDPRVVAENAQGPIAFALVGASLVGYLLGAAFLSSLDGSEPAAVERRRRLSDEPTPPRWRRRRRLYLALTVLSMIYPAVLIYAIDFAPETRAFLHELYGDRAAALTAVMNLGLLFLWLALAWIGFLGPLRRHRTGDRALLEQIEQDRRDAAALSPRLGFYVAVVCALGFMTLLVAMRYH